MADDQKMEDVQLFDFGAKKKKDTKKKTEAKPEVKPEQTTTEAKPAETEVKESKEYKDPFTYEMLLNRITNILKINNPTLAEKSKIVIKPPQLIKLKGRRTAWLNFAEICGQVKRAPEHVSAFIFAETGVEGAINGEQLVLKEKQQVKGIESLIKKYITEYVMCALCRNANTVLIKDSNTRLYMMKCESCQSTRTVQSIRTGYHAVTKADRKK